MVMMWEDMVGVLNSHSKVFREFSKRLIHSVSPYMQNSSYVLGYVQLQAAGYLS